MPWTDSFVCPYVQSFPYSVEVGGGLRGRRGQGARAGRSISSGGRKNLEQAADPDAAKELGKSAERGARGARQRPERPRTASMRPAAQRGEEVLRASEARRAGHGRRQPAVQRLRPGRQPGLPQQAARAGRPGHPDGLPAPRRGGPARRLDRHVLEVRPEDPARRPDRPATTRGCTPSTSPTSAAGRTPSSSTSSRRDAGQALPADRGGRAQRRRGGHHPLRGLPGQPQEHPRD